MENQEYQIEAKWTRKFVPIWSAQLFSLLGSSLVQFALTWWITQKTGSAAYLAAATFVAILPEALLSAFAGAIVDRLNRRHVMMISDGITACVTLVLAVLFVLNKVQIWHIFIVIFIRAVCGVLQWPAMQASTSLMVPEKHLARVAGINNALRGGLNVVAPPLGALLMSVLPFYQVVGVDVVTAAIAISLLLFIRIPQPVRQKTVVTPKTIIKDTWEGFKHIKNWKALLYVTMIAAALNFLLAPVNTLMPLMVTQHFKAGVWELSIVESCFGIGAVVGGLALGIWGGFKNKAATSFMGIIGIGCGTLLFGIAPSNLFWLGLAGSILMGFMNPIANGPLQAILQSKVAPEMQGRVMGATVSLCTAMMPLSLLVVTPLAELLGIRAWYWAGGALTALIGVGGFFIPTIMKLEHIQKEVSSVAIAAD